MGKQKPNALKFHGSSGRYRKQLVGWDSLPPRIWTGKKLSHKEYNANKRQLTSIQRHIIDTPDPFLSRTNTVGQRKKLKSALKLKSIPQYNISTDDNATAHRILRVKTILRDVPPIVVQHVLHFIPALLKICKATKVRIQLMGWLAWHQISGIGIDRYAALVGMSTHNYRLIARLQQVASAMNIQITDMSEIKQCLASYQRTYRRRYYKYRTEERMTQDADWRAVMTRELRRRVDRKRRLWMPVVRRVNNEAPK